MSYPPSPSQFGVDLASWLGAWERAILRLQRAHPSRWRVLGLSDGEVRDALTLALLEAVRASAEPASVTNESAALDVVRRAHRALRRSFRVDSTPMEFDDVPLLPRPLSQEDGWLEAEAEACRALAGSRAERNLSRPQRRWLEALKTAANEGEFFPSSHQLNLSAASRLLGKHRSSAQRAFEELKVRFGQELERIE